MHILLQYYRATNNSKFFSIFQYCIIIGIWFFVYNVLFITQIKSIWEKNISIIYSFITLNIKYIKYIWKYVF